ncbi:hypothetical protein CR513_46271, partial [Mucuna pruriens]
MLDKGNSNTGSTLVTRNGPTKRSTFEGKPFTKSSRGEYCMYCKRSGHTKDTCYKCYGKEKVLEQMGGNKGSTQMWVNQTTSDKENDIQAFSEEEMDRLRALLNSTSKPLGSCGLTMNGKSSFNIFGSFPQSIWILDSGATNHMTLFSSYFTSYLKVSKKSCSSLSLHNVIHVLKLANNLISIHRLIQDWNCAMIFFVLIMLFRNLQWGGRLELLKSRVGNNTNKEELPSSQWETSETWTTSQICLYHKRLGHPLFGLLKTMFPYLFRKEFFESFKCDIYQFSKHHCATFSPSNNRSLEPFDLIHSDVWGPASSPIDES